MGHRKTVDFTLSVPWGIIAGRTYGEENDVPVLCVHGRTDNLESFSPLIPLLPHNHYYVCIDLPGHGKSSHPHKGYIVDFVWYVFSVKRIINHFRWSKIYYLGHSFGGQIGYVLTAFYPELVLKLVVIDSLIYHHLPPANTSRALRELLFDAHFKLESRSSIDQAPTYTIDEFVQKMIETRKTEVTSEHIRPIAERNLVKVNEFKYRYGNDQRTKILNGLFFTFDQIKNIANEICCPTMLILGNKSNVTKPHDRLTHSPLHNNSNATFHIIEGDHDLHLVHTPQVARLVSTFLTKGTLSKL
ncbi:serine hydrolase-like protein [Macrosteles quadrilineatus]|uniref:serine hydrolase-like protein n=1 Tax=Macrosteles quadrilineatus TaxID=74068 RepID=UPI0023E3216D|nr:serine hydrolase-like protein [Macrosteles quadrilineatus]